MASDVTGKKKTQKRSSSAGSAAGSRNGSTGRSKNTGKSNSTGKNSGKKTVGGRKSSSNSVKAGNSRGSCSSRKSPDKNIEKDRAAGRKTGFLFGDERRQKLEDEIRFFVAIGITILLTMCNFHYCMDVGNMVYFILHGLFGWLAYILPFVLLGIYLFMIPNRENLEASIKVKLVLLLFVEFCWLFHFVGIKDSQTFSPIVYFKAGQEGINGGLIGGLFSGLLENLIGSVATVLIIFLAMLITVIILTERSAVHTIQKCVGMFHSFTGGKFRNIKEQLQEIFFYEEEDEDESESEYEYDDSNKTDYSDNTGNSETTDRADFGIKKQNLNRQWKSAGTPRRTTEFFTEKFPFMNDEAGYSGRVQKSDQTYETDGEYSAGKEVSREFSDERQTEQDFFDGNWRKGFASSMKEERRENDTPEDSSVKADDTTSMDVYASVPHSPSRVTIERDSRSLAEMGFEDILEEEKTQVTGSIDDFIVYNGIIQSAENADEASVNDEPVFDMEKAEDFQVPQEDTFISDREYDMPDNVISDSPVSSERAVDITEHVIFPEEGPVMRSTPSSDTGIWRQKSGDSSGGKSRETSGAVTFSSKPKTPEKKPVKKRPYKYPSSSLLKRNTAFNGNVTVSNTEIKEKLHETLQSFGVNVKMGGVSVGPAVTRYELEPEPGVKVSRIVALQDDIKLALAASDIRIEAPIPGKSAIGIEVPNKENTVVGFRELIESNKFQDHPSKVAVAVGRDISGQIIVADLAKMPHLLIAGATGSGKSVCINTLIMSIIYKATPDEVKLVMVDPKVVELSIYNGIPHLLVPVVTDARKAANALRWAVDEMNDRYKKFAEYNVRNIEGYNEHLRKEKAKDPSNEEPYLYQMVIIVDELADLMMVAQNEVEEAICRLAQMARAAGIHLVLATQRPSVNVITGLIKANVPSRIAFAVSSGVDSRTIIDMNGAEKLLGKGDMLFYPYGLPKPVRVQGAFISDEEVSRVVGWLHKNNGEISGQEMMEKMITSVSESAAVKTERDEYFESAARFIIEKDKASIGALQRNFKIGFNRAARIMDQLAAAGVVGEEDGTKPRKILMNMDEFNQFMESG